MTALVEGWGSWLQPLLTPWALGLIGLLIGSFLNVVAHRLPLMMERQWWADVVHQLRDADSYERVFGQPAPAAAGSVAATLGGQIERLPPLGLARMTRLPPWMTPVRRGPLVFLKMTRSICRV